MNINNIEKIKNLILKLNLKIDADETMKAHKKIIIELNMKDGNLEKKVKFINTDTDLI